MADEVTFSDEQQELVNKRIGEARIKARELAKAEFEKAASATAEAAALAKLELDKDFEKAIEMHKGRVAELEPFEAEAKAYRELVAGMLKDKVKALGDAAKTAVKALPEGLSDLDKLNWLTANEALFETDTRKVPGTPAGRVKRPAGKSGRPEGYKPLGM